MHLTEFKNWNPCKPKYGYDIGTKHDTGVLKFSSQTRNDMGIHIIYTGKTIRRCQDTYNMNALDILGFHLVKQDKIARMDVAIDFINCDTPVKVFQKAFESGHCKTRLRSASVVKSLTNSGYTLYIGSRKNRKKLLRIYNKAAEQKIDGDWIRVELQVMQEPATVLAYKMFESDEPEKCIVGAIDKVCSFPTIEVWKEITSDNPQIKIGSVGSNDANTRRWLEMQVVPALAREIRLDYDYWIQFKLAVEESVKQSNANE